VNLKNSGDEPVFIEAVRILGVTDGFQLLGIRTRPVPGIEEGMFIGDQGFPPQNFVTKPLAEQNVVLVPDEFNPDGEPIGGLELAIGVTVSKPGVAGSRAVEVTYRVGDKQYREEFPAEIYLCAPADAYPGDTCPGDARGRFGDGTVGEE
jgi:hypothetical protein